MNEKKILKIWQTVSTTQKAVLYAYLSMCDDGPSLYSFVDPTMNELGSGCDWAKFYMAVEKDGYADHRKEINKIMEDIGGTGLIFWPQEKNAAKKKLIKPRKTFRLLKRNANKRQTLSPDVYDFLLFSKVLSDSDKKLRDTYFSKPRIVKMAIRLEKPDDFIIPMIENSGFSQEELTDLFHIAAYSSSLEIVKKLVELGADYKSKDSHGNLSVINAAPRQKYPEVLCYLAEKGCPLTEHDLYGQNILHLAAKNPLPCVLERLLPLVPHEYIEEKDLRNSRTPLGSAYRHGNKKNMKILIKAGADKTTAKEQERFCYEPDPGADSDEEIVGLRYRNNHFEWTAENTQKIISVIQGIDKKVNQMYDAVEKAMKFLQSDAIPNNRIKNDFSIKASMSYENYENPIPTADEEMLWRLYNATNWNILPSIYANEDRMESREDQLYLGLNWDIELFDRPELEHIKITYYVHVLFVDSYTYTLNDMIHMNPDDFMFSLEINIDGEKIL